MYSQNDYRYYLEHRLSESDDFLAHYGVKNMKWGKRKTRFKNPFAPKNPTVEIVSLKDTKTGKDLKSPQHNTIQEDQARGKKRTTKEHVRKDQERGKKRTEYVKRFMSDYAIERSSNSKKNKTSQRSRKKHNTSNMTVTGTNNSFRPKRKR